MKQAILIVWLGVLLLTVGCRRERFDPAPQAGPAPGEKVALRFRLAGKIATRAADDIAAEEGNVKTLSYAIFQGYRLKRSSTLDLTGRQAGSEWLETNLDKNLFDPTTEIFAIGNAPAQVVADLFHTPAPDVPVDNPLLQQVVADSVDLLARIYVYDNILIPNQTRTPGKYPYDRKLLFKPASATHYLSMQYTLAPDQTFKSYDELMKKRGAASDDVRAMYDAILEDLECRLTVYQNSAYTNKKNEYAAGEASTRAIAYGLATDPTFTRYIQWCDYRYGEDLNRTADTSAARLLAEPLMAGYVALNEDIGSIITVPVEHVYCRIWFRFSFVGDPSESFSPQEPYIDLGSITVEGLPMQTKLFNLSGNRVENNIAGANNGTVSIVPLGKTGTGPFFGNLSASPHHLDATPQLRYYPARPAYHTVSRYALSSPGTADTSHAKRYYVYAYQWGGSTLADDPLVTIRYAFTAPAGDKIVTKSTSARLYDETRASSKRHHGLLRNYTYGVDCQINGNTQTLGLQVTPWGWYEETVDDIPSFD